APARPLREHAARRQGAVRIGLPDDHARPVARRLRGAGDPARGAAEDPEAQRRPPARPDGELTRPCATRGSARGPPAADACHPTASLCGTAMSHAPTPSSTSGAATWPTRCPSAASVAATGSPTWAPTRSEERRVGEGGNTR